MVMDYFFEIIGQIALFILVVFIITKINYYFSKKKIIEQTYKKCEDGSVELIKTGEVKNIGK